MVTARTCERDEGNIYPGGDSDGGGLATLDDGERWLVAMCSLDLEDTVCVHTMVPVAQSLRSFQCQDFFSSIRSTYLDRDCLIGCSIESISILCGTYRWGWQLWSSVMVGIPCGLENVHADII